MQSQRHAAKKKGAPQLGPEERKEQVIKWTLWRATHSPENVPDELKKWAAGAVPHGNRKAFEEFIRNPEGKEYVLFFPDEESAVRFAKFLSNCGIMKKVNAHMPGIGIEDNLKYTLGPDDTVKLVLTAEALKQPRALGKKEMEAYALTKAGKRTREGESDAAMLDELGTALKTLDPGVGMDSNLPIPRKVAKTKEEGEEEKLAARAMPMRRKSESASKRNMPLFPDAKSRDRFMEAYNGGWQFSFQLRGSTSLEPTFRKALEECGMRDAKVAFTEVKKNTWRVELNKGVGTDYAKLFQEEVNKIKEGTR